MGQVSTGGGASFTVLAMMDTDLRKPGHGFDGNRATDLTDTCY
jgi:hypothetical protein